MTLNKQILELLDMYPVGARARRRWEPKRGGGMRPITKPDKELDSWLKTLNNVLNDHFNQWPDFMHGGIKGRSYKSFARPHVGKQCVISIDVRRFFDSISARQVSVCFEEYLGLDTSTALRLAKRLCFSNRIAQGFSTSNFVCNLHLLRPLIELHEDFSSQGFDFTNYVDDLALSGDIFNPAEVINHAALVLSRAGLSINKSDKIRVMPSTGRQIICGLLVNRRLTITRTKKQELLGAVSSGAMNRASIDGWAANLKEIDPAFCRKLKNFADKKATI
jgi:RNA-directed DNA polymerase